jgi:pimeloyl-ACP methyl ester carboxylesterase
LIRYDERGCGFSDTGIGEPSVDVWVGDLETVVDAVGLERFALLGVSPGAAIAVAYAARHPDRVSDLVLYGGYARGRQFRGRDEEEDAIVAAIRAAGRRRIRRSAGCSASYSCRGAVVGHPVLTTAEGTLAPGHQGGLRRGGRDARRPAPGHHVIGGSGSCRLTGIYRGCEPLRRRSWCPATRPGTGHRAART